MRRSTPVVAWLTLVALAHAGAAQVPFLVGYGTVTAAAVTRVIRGPGEVVVTPRARVRVRIADSTLEGNVASIMGDSLVLETADGTRAFSDSRLDDLKVSVGSRSRWAEGFLTGLGVGALSGAVLGYASGDDHGDGFLNFTAGEKAAILGGGLGIVGSAIGALAGALNPREGWARPKRPLMASSLAVVPVIGRQTSVALRMTF